MQYLKHELLKAMIALDELFCANQVKSLFVASPNRTHSDMAATFVVIVVVVVVCIEVFKRKLANSIGSYLLLLNEVNENPIYRRAHVHNLG